jgi:broad specificity phosphatase PhoE
VGVILLVRHGQASWGAADYDQLSETGQEQSRVLGRALARRVVVPSVVVAGAMRRHGQTARALLDGAGWDCSVVVDDGWDEFDHVQMLEVHGPPEGSPVGSGGSASSGDSSGSGLSPPAFGAWFDAWFEAARQRWVSGRFDDEYDESFSAFTDRVESALRRASSGLGPGGVAVVSTSGGPLSWVAASLVDGGVGAWKRLSPVTVNASVTKVVVGGRGTTLVSFNDHSHLETADPSLVTYR